MGKADRPSGESWLLFAGKVTGGVEELQRIQREYDVQSKHVILDVAHFTNTVCKWIVENGWRGAWGDEKKGFIHTELSGQRVIRVYSPVQYRDPMLGTSFASEGNEKARYVYGANDPIKDLLAVLRYSEPPIFHVHTDVPVDYQRHMNAEIKTTKRSFQTNRVVVPPSVLPLDCAPLNRPSTSSTHRMHGAIARAVAKAVRQLRSLSPTIEPNSLPASSRRSGTLKIEPAAWAVSDLPVPGWPHARMPRGLGRP